MKIKDISITVSNEVAQTLLFQKTLVLKAPLLSFNIKIVPYSVNQLRMEITVTMA